MAKGGGETVLQTQRERDPLTLEEKDYAAHRLSEMMQDVTRGRALTLDTAQALGAKDSAHDVFFVRTEDKDEHGKRMTLACKRFRRLENAQREMNGIDEAQDRGFKTLDPAGRGIMPLNGLGYFFVTEQMPRFTTMNYLGWRDFYAGQPDYDRKAAAPLAKMGQFAARVHSAGIKHGDFQVKNIAQNLAGDFVLFDLEDAVFYDKSKLNGLDFISNVSDDLQVLVSSLVTRGYLWSSTDATFQQEVMGNLLDPYLDNLTLDNEYIIDGAAHAVEEALTLRTQLHGDFSSRMGMPS